MKFFFSHYPLYLTMDNAEKNDIYMPPQHDIQDNCNCYHCFDNRNLYNTISQSSPRWLTISPRADDRHPDKYLDVWYEEFIKIRKFSSNILGVVEFENLRMHFHIVYSVTDRVKEYKTINSWRQTCQVKVYNGLPRGGLHYLFKSIEDTKQLISTNKYMITMDTIEQEIIRRGHKIRKSKIDVLDYIVSNSRRGDDMSPDVATFER